MGAIVNGLTLNDFRGLRRDVPDLQRLHARRDPAGRADEAAVDLRLYARLDRAGRGRADPPADRAAGGAAGRCRACGGAAGRRATRPRSRGATRCAATEPPDAPSRCSRQGVPTWNPRAMPDDAIERGAYVLRDRRRAGPAGADPDRDRLGGHMCLRRPTCSRPTGSRPAWSACRAWSTSPTQDADYRDSVLPPRCRARVAVEAASPMGWDRWVGDLGRGDRDARHSAPPAPAAESYKHFGFTARARRRRGPGTPTTSRMRSDMSNALPQVNPRLRPLTQAGVSVWLDQIRRSLVEGGELARMVARGQRCGG